MAVSDGAGSAKFAELGAETAVSTAIDRLETSIVAEIDPQQAVRAAFDAAREEIIRRATDVNADLREFSATLLLVVAGSEMGAVGQIGDGVIAAKGIEEGWSYLFWPQNGEYANVTRFVTDEDAPDWFQSDKLPKDVLEFSVLTDGLEPLALDFAHKCAHSPFFEGFAAGLRQYLLSGEDHELSEELGQFLTSKPVRDRVDDDLTLIVASRLP